MVRQNYPLNALRAFEAAGRHLSFVRAAEELSVTPAAISQQVKRLEDYLSVQLFQRLPHGLSLTKTGKYLLPELREAFMRLDSTVEWARTGDTLPVKGDGSKITQKNEAAGDFSDQRAIVVLPFANMSGDPEQEYFADGLTEEIIAELSRNSDLIVLSRGTTFAYKATRLNAQQLSEELGVRYILEGSVRKSGDHVRVRSQLVDGHTGHNVWGERYDRDSIDIGTLQDEIVSRIVVSIGGTGGKLDQLARTQAFRKVSDNLAAYDCFLRGREYINRYRVRDKRFAQAGEMFEKAIELDPGFSRAYLGLAWFHVWEVKGGRTDAPGQSLERAFELARVASNIDRTAQWSNWNHWSHWIAGNIQVWNRDAERAIAHHERALELNPNDTFMLMDISDNCCYLGRAKQAIDLMNDAIRLHPDHPDVYLWVLAFAYFTEGQYEKTLAWLQRMTEPGDSRRLLAATYAKLGRLEEARAAAEEFLKEWPHFSISRWAEYEPYQNPADLENYVDGLRKAGLPE